MSLALRGDVERRFGGPELGTGFLKNGGDTDLVVAGRPVVVESGAIVSRKRTRSAELQVGIETNVSENRLTKQRPGMIGY